ncbi:hypothetical protein [Acidovorax sp. CCYZU-2555]|uniref:hypothetical protein n=1 Tax=Acidovorax sp. CCYZU-2555 TaxID=2835042 RepID=UPI001BCD343D|nr:hypothetical protein [Acidovorax sp. CCYZU-2555]MBS7776572.1 hypothetical protein [Acidovorax sp. CCYZU-2555]
MHKHAWQFFRAGGVDQVAIRTGEDIARIGELDQTLWVALACPTRGIEFDSATLDLIDHDKDGRIRAPELVAACEWAVAQVNDPDVLTSGSDVLQLASLRTDTDEGAALRAEAERILRWAEREGEDGLTLAEVQKRLAALNAMPFNGDGLLNPKTLSEAPELIELVDRIMALYGSAEGVDGQPGMALAALDAFFADVRAIQAWHDQALDHACVLTQREQAMAAAQALNAVQEKIEDFFARTRLAAFDATALVPLSPSVEGYAALGQDLLSSSSESIAALPLASVVAGGELPLAHNLNPAWSEAMQAFRLHVVQPLLGADRQSLSAAQWQALQAQLAPCQAWLAAYPGSVLGDMSPAQAQALLEGGAQARLQELIARDEEEKQHNQHAVQLEKLIRYQRDLLKLLNNFVNFADFYRREGAAFQAGTLYLDGRSCELTVDVTDAAAHAKLAGLAKVYLAYCDCRRNGVKRSIVAAFTAGDVDFLLVGRNGLFYDREGKDWDATISKIIENPTSIGQAFSAPYKKFLRMIEEQVAKRAAAQDSGVTAGLSTQAQALVNTPATAAAAPVPGLRKTDVGTVAAIGVALGSLSAVAVGIFGKFIELGPWIPIALLGMIVAISGPSMLIAWLKLRQRSLGPILDASGWAINGRMKINLRLGRSLSQTAKVPVQASRLMHDPYADSSAWVWWAGAGLLALAIGVLAWRLQWIEPLLPAAWKAAPAVTVPAVAAPAPAAPAPVPVPGTPIP